MTKKILLNIAIRGLIHIAFWCCVLLFFTFFFKSNLSTYQDTIMFALFLMPITIATTYVSIYKLIPDYLIKKRYKLFALYCTYTLIISCYLIIVSIFFSLIYLANFEYANMNPYTQNIILVVSAVYLIVILVSAFRLLKLNSENVKRNQALEKKILETQLQLKEQELNYLKMQIHPHFLFNTLNTLYGFALKKADETHEMILKLSNLLDYLLYQVDKPFVLLTEEINHIDDYIELEKMRFNKTLQVTFKHDAVNTSTQIAPMLFIPFIENSFKHGSLINGVLYINIVLQSTEDSIIFSIENSSFNDELISENGIGLENIKKRLELLYQDRYTLQISNKDSRYQVKLNINLKS